MDKTIRYVEQQKGNGKLVILDKTGKIQVHELGARCLIGRRCQGSVADIQLSSELASRQHGEVVCRADGCFYKDLGSTNGTYINGMLFGKETATENKPIPLKTGDVFRIDNSSKEMHHPEAVLMIYVTDFNDDVEWRRQLLDDKIAEINIGRAQAAITVDNAAVSQQHASFFLAHRGWAIADHRSTNGVFLNGIRIEKPQYLYPMDVVRIVNIYFIYDGKSIFYPVKRSEKENKGKMTADGEELVIRITEKTVWQRFKKLTLLQDANLTVKPGEMVLILGGSGAGKTTFMNAVMGYEKAQGTILHGDTNIYTEYEKMKYQIGYVPQQDLLRGSDTVYDTLSDAAKMKLPKKVTKEERKKRIEEVLDMVGLRAEARSQVSKISGGQRKRLSVAVELIANPSLLFLDEADSGLDGPNSKTLMENARAIADDGKIVMVITHAPDRVAEHFDKVIVLAKSVKDNSGHLAFYGPLKEAYQFFETDTLEGIVKRINRKDEGGGEGLSDYYIEKYKNKQQA